MVMDDAKNEQIREVFKTILQYEERKRIAKSMKKTYAEYVSEVKGEPDTLIDALEIVAVVCKAVE